MTALQQNALIKAEDFVQQGEKSLKKFSLFSTQKYEDAVELFGNAATQYKIAKKPKESGDNFRRAGELSEQLKNMHEACQHYVNAGKAYRTVDPAETTRVFNIAIKMHLENNRFATAAKLYKELGDVAVEDSDFHKAIEHFGNAADCYMTENQTTTANQCKLKIAQLCAQVEDYQRAIQLYEEIALSSLDNNLLKWSVKDYYFKALLCQMALDAKSQDFEASDQALGKYQDLDPSFENSRECKLVASLLEACKDMDLDKFSDLTYDFDRISKLDEWKTSILFQVKSGLRNEGGGGGGLDDDVDDLS